MFSNNNLEKMYIKYREGKLAHAYLIETNNIANLINDLKKFIKIINCPENYSIECQNCNLCNLVDKNNLPSLITIEPEGSTIKKSQIEDLKINFNSKPIYAKYNIYIIKNAEKLNSSSANAMLKFVEEPTEGILGFFLTSNKDIIIPTIKSRCQTLVINYDNNSIEEKLNLNENELSNYQEMIHQYLYKIENNEMINHKELILNKLSERKEIELMFKIIFEIYFNYFLKNLSKPYNKKLTDIYQININNQIIIKIINILTKFLQDLSYNVNIELLLDKFVIEMRCING